MKWTLDGYGSNLTSNAVLSSYKDNGIIIYDDQCLNIVRGFTKNKESVEVKHSVKINPVPCIFNDTKILRIHSSSDGSRIVLVTEKDLFVILVPPEVHNTRSARNEYYCECVPLHRSLNTNNRLTIVCERLVPSAGLPQIAVLFSDSCIRFYSMSALDDYIQSLEVDFLPFMSLGDVTANNRLGFIKSITSFDFITSTPNHKIAAIDTDGDMFLAYLSDQNSYSVKLLISPPTLPCDPTELRCVDHPFSEIFTVLSIFTPSQSGVLSHLILVETETDVTVSIHEQVALPSSSKTVSLLLSDRTCSYLISAQNRLYFMDIRPWIVLYGQILTSGAVPATLPDSRLHTLAVSCEGEQDKTVSCQTVIANCYSVDDEETLSMFVSYFSRPRLISSFLKSEIGFSTKAIEQPKQTVDVIGTFKEMHLDAKLAKKHILPKVVSSNTLPELQRIEQTEKWLRNFTENININREAAVAAIKRVVELQPEVEKNEKMRQHFNERLLNLFDSLADIKYKMERKNAAIRQLFNRLATLTTRLSGTVPLNTQEEKMFSVLKEYKSQVLNYAVKIPQLSVTIADEKRKAFGPAVPFEPSINSRLNTINKLTCEVDAITARLEKLMEKYDQVENLQSSETV